MNKHSPSWESQIKEAKDARASEDPSVSKGLFAAALLGEHKYSLPKIDALTETLRDFETLSDEEKDTLLACEQVHRLRDWISTVSEGALLQSKKAERGAYGLIIASQQMFDRHIEALTESGLSKACVDRVLLTKENLKKLKPSFVSNSIDWTEYLISILPDEVHYIANGFLNMAFRRAEREILAERRPLAERLGVGTATQLPQMYEVDEDTLSSFRLRTDSNSEEMEEVKRYRDELDELSRGRASIAQERMASDKIRMELIPQLVKKRCSFQESYWTLHKARFSEEPHLIQNFSTTPFEFSDYVSTSVASDVYQDQIGSIRKVPVRGGDHFAHIPPIYLRYLEQRFFQSLEQSFRQVESFNELTELIAKADCFLQIAHLPFDGAGRTTEDFLVYVAARAGYDISVSSSGYRHLLNGGVSIKGATCGQFQNEVDQKALRNFGLTPGPYEDGNWLIDTEALVTALTKKGDTALYVNKALQAYYFIQWIEDGPQGTYMAGEQYDYFDPLADRWRIAVEQEYIDSSEAPTEELDTLIAEALITPPHSFREKLYQLQDTLPEHPLTSLFFQSYLDGKASSFMSGKQQLHWDHLREDLRSGKY